VIVATHGVVLRHWGLVRKIGLIEGLGHVLGNPELVDVLVVARQILRHGHLFLALHVAIGHVHSITRCKIRHLECTAQRSGGSATFHRKAVILAGFVPTGGCQGIVAIKTGGSGSWRFQRGEARSHRGAFTGAQRVTVNLDSQTIGDLLALRSHVVEIFGLEVSSSDGIDAVTWRDEMFSPVR